MLSDGELVRQTLDGQNSAYEELVRRWAARVTALCHAKTGKAQAAEDLAQETLMRGYRSLASISEPEKFGPWLCGIALRACFDWIKAKGKSPVNFGALEGSETVASAIEDLQAEKAKAHKEEHEQVMREVEALAEPYRETLMLFYYEELSYEQIATVLGVSAAAVNARLTRARAMLREKLSRSGS